MDSRWLTGSCLLAAWLLGACGDPAFQRQDAGEDAEAADGFHPQDADPPDAGSDEGPDGAGDGADALVCDPAAPEVVELGDLALGELRAGVPLGACEEHRHVLVAARGQTLELRLSPDATLGRARLVVAYPDDPTWRRGIAQLAALEPGQPARLRLSPPRSGELVLLVRAMAGAGAGAYDLEAACLAGCDLETTRFPVMLVHGWTGWSQIGPYTYFYQVPQHLEARGYPVCVASLDPYNAVEVRAPQLVEQIDACLLASRARKLSLVAHSQGGLDARRAISALERAERVAALFTISTPHQGTPLCDVALGYLPGPAQQALAFLLNWLGATAAGAESDAMASFEAMTTRRVQESFNPAHPDDPRVLYRSWAGRTCALGLTCGDICDVEIQLGYDILWAMGYENDGVVPVESALWGEYRGEIPADHFDEVGQLLGITGPNFDHKRFYLERARELGDEGF
jgi:triacylglycerol esterase/lipase EstA (alpha/beta hydrolase family)